MDSVLKELDLRVGHMGINLENEEKAKECVALMALLFGLEENKAKDSAGACFTGTEIEWLKGGGRGTHGHFAVSTLDIPKARIYLETKGVEFDENSIKTSPDGTIDIIYAVKEIGGFAWHLLQR